MKTTGTAKPKPRPRLTQNSKIIRTIIDAILDKKGEEIVSLNLKKIPEAVADYFIVCEASNPNLIKAIAENIEKKVIEECGEKPHTFDGKHGGTWMLVDYVDVIVHCMLPETRAYYNVEDLWHDAEKKEHN